jgi:hypothetical protein
VNDQANSTDALVKTIRSRGYWQVQLRPVAFEEKRISSLAALEHALRRAHVQLRGWDYPHIDERQGEIGRHKDFVQGTANFGAHHEVWRLYQSAQFVHLFTMMEDWLEVYGGKYDVKPGEILEVNATLWMLTEMFLFFGRLVEALNLTGDVVVSYKLVGLAGRQLQTLDPLRHPLMEWRKAATELHEYGDDVTRPSATLIGSARDLAVAEALKLYERFHWEPDRASVVEEQRKLLERRFS